MKKFSILLFFLTFTFFHQNASSNTAIPEYVKESCSKLPKEDLDIDTIYSWIKPINKNNNPKEGVAGYFCVQSDGNGDPFHWQTFSADGKPFGGPTTCHVNSDGTGVFTWLESLFTEKKPSAIEKINSNACSPEKYSNEIKKRAAKKGNSTDLSGTGISERNKPFVGGDYPEMPEYIPRNPRKGYVIITPIPSGGKNQLGTFPKKER